MDRSRIDLIIHKGRVGEVYNVGGHNEKQNIEIVKIICKELGKPESLITHVGDRKGHDMRYISTDYVFDGQGTDPWQPDCKDYKPLNVYGQTKLEGELAVSQTLEKYFIVRIAWVFGLNGKNFIKTMLNVGKTHDTVRVVNDQIGTPTYACPTVPSVDDKQ